MVEFGERLRTLRKERNLTQKQLATLIGVKNSVISFYEVGDRTPSPEVLKKLAVALHVSADTLLGIEPITPDTSFDTMGLDENDKKLVRSLIETLRNKNKK